MELNKKIYQLRKLAGMTQEQLAEKLNVSRQTLSKWENGSSVPDVESVVRLSALFHTSLEELLLEEAKHVEEEKTQITLEDLMRINAHNRRMNMLLCSGLLFLAIGIIIAAFERMLETTTVSLTYILYRYIAVGRYDPAPVNYTRLMFPAILAGIVGVVLCMCYFWGNRKEEIGRREKKEMKKQYLVGVVALTLVLVLTVCTVVFAKAGKNEEDNDPDNDLYGQIIAGLGDDEQFSLRNIGEKNNVLFTTDMTYDDGNGHNAAVYCDVYYALEGEVYPLGSIESMGTAFPISFGEKCIYTASEHSLEVYRFDTEKKQWTVRQYEERFDENGDAAYQCIEDGEAKTISEKEYLDAMEEYGKGTVINFGYGASDNPY
ncbi:MAG: helix-turn-helix transcriptional regulator [Lachnospiraceae bacterium]|nr:helix-turn-helix transcriptional regulator [Lachnospiraceae bacterium]